MAGFDQKSNVVLSDSKERVYSMEDGVEEIPLGLYLVKGDQMYVLLSLHVLGTGVAVRILSNAARTGGLIHLEWDVWVAVTTRQYCEHTRRGIC